jgi:hypothetical protein
MPDPSLHTTQLRGWMERMAVGDLGAREQLLRAVNPAWSGNIGYGGHI